MLRPLAIRVFQRIGRIIGEGIAIYIGTVAAAIGAGKKLLLVAAYIGVKLQSPIEHIVGYFHTGKKHQVIRTLHDTLQAAVVHISDVAGIFAAAFQA